LAHILVGLWCSVFSAAHAREGSLAEEENETKFIGKTAADKEVMDVVYFLRACDCNTL